MPVKAPLPPWNEHLFWSGILEDHAVFVIDQAAERYRQAFGQLRSRCRRWIRRLPSTTNECLHSLETPNP